MRIRQDGNLVPMADNLVKFNLTGPGSIRAVDNGNAATVKPFHADHRKAFTGMALLIISSQKRQAGRIHITATSEGLAAGAAEIASR